ncbi:hypothetical protein ACT3SP_10260 [Brachybacterium sp. AOP43-C2-M15]|uniref:hypothetical protein n=1 Tax=Brachybacterium sp. AOP43-C2-M15 TaxID=3457661 RepID=UPI0040344220
MDTAENNPAEEGLGNRTRELNGAAAREALENCQRTGEARRDHSETTDVVDGSGNRVDPAGWPYE